MSHDLESSPGPADQAVANDYDSFAEAYAAETESNLLNGYYTRPAVLDLAGDVAGRRILDVGCGAGPLLEALRERGAVVTGVDSSTKMLELARQRLGDGADLHPADLSSPLPFPDESDCVIEQYKTAQRDRLAALCGAAGVAEPELLADELFLLLEGARVSAQSFGPNGPASRLARMGEALIASHLASPASR